MAKASRHRSGRTSRNGVPVPQETPLPQDPAPCPSHSPKDREVRWQSKDGFRWAWASTAVWRCSNAGHDPDEEFLFLFGECCLVLERWGPTDWGDQVLHSTQEMSIDEALAWLSRERIPVCRWPDVLRPAYLQRELKGSTPAGPPVRHGPDFRSVLWHGTP